MILFSETVETVIQMVDYHVKIHREDTMPDIHPVMMSMRAYLAELDLIWSHGYRSMRNIFRIKDIVADMGPHTKDGTQQDLDEIAAKKKVEGYLRKCFGTIESPTKTKGKKVKHEELDIDFKNLTIKDTVDQDGDETRSRARQVNEGSKDKKGEIDKDENDTDHRYTILVDWNHII